MASSPMNIHPPLWRACVMFPGHFLISYRTDEEDRYSLAFWGILRTRDGSSMRIRKAHSMGLFNDEPSVSHDQSSSSSSQSFSRRFRSSVLFLLRMEDSFRHEPLLVTLQQHHSGLTAVWVHTADSVHVTVIHQFRLGEFDNESAHGWMVSEMLSLRG